MSHNLMQGKRGLIMGLANDKSIAWGIAKACAEAGAEMCFSYQGDALKKRVEPLAAQVGSDFVAECDVADASSVDALFEAIKKNTWLIIYIKIIPTKAKSICVHIMTTFFSTLTLTD